MESATTVEQYIYEALKEKNFRLHNNETSGAEWAEKAFEFDKSAIYENYISWCEREHIKQPQTSQKLSRGLKRLIPSTKEIRNQTNSKRSYIYSLPGIQTARVEFEKAYKVDGTDIWN